MVKALWAVQTQKMSHAGFMKLRNELLWSFGTLLLLQHDANKMQPNGSKNTPICVQQ